MPPAKSFLRKWVWFVVWMVLNEDSFGQRDIWQLWNGPLRSFRIMRLDPRHTSWLNVYQSISRQNITKWRRYPYLSLCWWIGKYKFCIRAKWPIKPELIPASVACSNWEYLYSPLDGMLVQNTAVVKVLYESWAWVSSKYQEKMRGQTLHFLLVSTQ